MSTPIRFPKPSPSPSPIAAEPPVDFAPPAIGDAEIAEVVAVLKSGWLSTGPRVAQFEKDFAAYVGAPHAIAVNSCTAALHLSLLASGVQPGDDVITTPLTFCSTANVIVHAGATPVFADIDPTTFNLHPAAAQQAVTQRTRAIVPVDFGGRPASISSLRTIARRAGAVLIEDAAHAVEGVAQGEKIGSAADLTCFSFYATKNLTTGEGGMVTTLSDEWAERIRVSSLHGMSRDAWARYQQGGPTSYDVVAAGFKYNMSDLQAAIGLHQLAGLEARLRRREAIWKQYDDGLAVLPITRPFAPPPGDRHSRHLYTILVDQTRTGRSRDQLQMALRQIGIATSVHFKPVHLHSFYADRYGFKRGMFPVAEAIGDQILSLPLSAAMTDDQVSRTIEALYACLR